MDAFVVDPLQLLSPIGIRGTGQSFPYFSMYMFSVPLINPQLVTPERACSPASRFRCKSLGALCTHPRSVRGVTIETASTSMVSGSSLVWVGHYCCPPVSASTSQLVRAIINGAQKCP